MKTTYRIYSIMILFLLLASISCKKDQLSYVPPFSTSEFIGNYIVSYTGRDISVGDEFVIHFSTDKMKKDKMGVETNGVVFVEPNVKGKVYWKDATTLIFDPDEYLKFDAYYKLIINLDVLFDGVDPANKKVYLEYRTNPLQLSVSKAEYSFSDDPGQPQLQLSGQINFPRYFDAKLLENAVKVSQKGNSQIKLHWDHAVNQSSYLVEGISRLAKEDSEVLLSWDGGSSIPHFTGEQTIKIPKKSEFSLVAINSSNEGDRKIEILFSDIIKQNQNLAGMISIQDYTGQISMEGMKNKIIVYPSTDVPRDISLVVDQRILDSEGRSLNREERRQISFEPTKPQLQVLRSGIIIPDVDKVLIPFQAKNLKYVDIKISKIFQNNVLQFLQSNELEDQYGLNPVGRKMYHEKIDLESLAPEDNTDEWVRYAIDLKKMVATDPGSIYKIVIGFRNGYAKNIACDEEKEETVIDDSGETGYWGNEDDIEEYGDHYYYSEDGYSNPCKRSYYTSSQFIYKTIMASNIGIIAKSDGENRMKIMCTDILTAEAMAGAEIEVFDFQKQSLAKGTTNSKGFLDVPKVSEKPAFIVVKKDKQYGYVDLEDNKSNSLSEFDVSGNEKNQGIDGFIYGERGVWRPGDTMHLCFILQDVDGNLPKDHPVKAIVSDARGKKRMEKLLTTHVGPMYYFPVPTSYADPTGNWKAQVTVGNASFNKIMKVETIKPNRLKINFDLKDKELVDLSQPKGAKMNFSSRWLHGASAEGLRAEVEAKMTSTETSFEKFKSFTFDDPARKLEGAYSRVYEGSLDRNGRAEFTLQKGSEIFPPGFIQLNMKTRVYEKSGNFSEDYISTTASPYNSYVGIKIPQSRWGGNYIKSGENIKIPLVLVDKNGKPVSGKKLDIGLYNAEWDWWYYRGTDNLYKYNSTMHIGATNKYSATTNQNGEAVWETKFENYGNYMVRVCDVESGHCTGAFFYTSVWGTPPNSSGSPKIFNITSDKTEYKVGEEIKLNIPSSEGSKVLISVETGKSINQAFWIAGKNGNVTINVPALASMTPNAYIHATLVQQYKNSGNDLPIRLYGVLPIKVVDGNTRLQPKIAMATSIEPDRDYTIKVSETSGKKMNYTLAVVDEGLLDITRFQTPDPWNHFFAKQALGVRTWDIFDLIASPYGDRVESVISIGGDAAIGNGASLQKANRFKPVVRYYGPYSLEAGKSASHVININNYVGSVKAMVVASNETAYGSAEAIVTVKKPLMVQVTLPRVLAPDEEVYLGANVFAMEDNINKVVASVITDPLMNVLGASSNIFTFNKAGDELYNFSVKANSIGTSKVKVSATSGKLTSMEEVEMEIRNPNPFETKSIESSIIGGSSSVTNFDLFGVPGSNTASIELSTLPPFKADERLKYLIRFPYGCLEQTVSAVFPQLYLSDIIDLSAKDKSKVDDAIRRGIQRLALFQTSSGAFSYWPGNSEIYGYANSYAGEFLLEAKNKGYLVPQDMLDRWVKYQKKVAAIFKNSSIAELLQESNEDQASRLYSLAKAGQPDLGAMNRLRTTPKLDQISSFYLASAYALTGKKDVALTLIKNKNQIVERYLGYGNNFGSDLRDEAIMAETYSLLGNVLEEKKMVEAISKDLNSDDWYSTHSTSYGLLTLGKFYQKVDKQGVNAIITYNGKEIPMSSVRPMLRQDLSVGSKINGHKLSVKNKGKSYLFANLVYSGQRKVGSEGAIENKGITMDIKYYNMNHSPLSINAIPQGSNFYALITVNNISNQRYLKNMALTYVIPSGWEIQNERVTGISLDGSSAYSFQDVRDDRINTFFHLSKGQAFVSKILLTATYAGKFYLPTTLCSAMYNNDIRASGKGQWLNVTLANGKKEL